MTFGNERATSPIEKVRLVRPGVILAFAGDAGDEMVLEEWLRAYGRDPKKYPTFREKADFHAIVITRTGMYEYDETTSGNGSVIDAPRCIGSGADFARSILEANKVLGAKFSALDAVKVASAIDVYTGPPFKTLDIKKTLAKRKI